MHLMYVDWGPAFVSGGVCCKRAQSLRLTLITVVLWARTPGLQRIGDNGWCGRVVMLLQRCPRVTLLVRRRVTTQPYPPRSVCAHSRVLLKIKDLND